MASKNTSLRSCGRCAASSPATTPSRRSAARRRPPLPSLVILAQTTNALPDNTGYVAAAYLVFFALVLIYVVIMAAKLSRFERELTELDELADERAARRQRERRRRRAEEAAGDASCSSLGISHKTAPVALRERLALTERARRARFMRELVAHDEVHEAVAISTCNRTEIYLVDRATPCSAEADAAGQARPAGPASARPSSPTVVYSPRNCDAARQLYRVTARPGVDDRRRGEVQGQVRRAYEARARGRHDRADDEPPVPAPRCRPASACARRPASARERVSVSTRRRRPRPRGRRRPRVARASIIIGAGETAELTAQALADQGVGRSSSPTATPTARARWPSASAARSARSTRCPSACSRPTSSSPRPPRRTRSSAPRSSPRHAARATAARSCSSTSPSRATSSTPAASSRASALYDIDDLQAVVGAQPEVREGERARAEAVVEEEIQRFARWMAQLDVVPTIAALREHGAEIVDQVLAENAGPLGERCRRATSRASRRSRARSCSGCCTSRRSA